MTKYTVASQRRAAQRHDLQKQTHAVWRGIGCLLMVIVPLISWVLAAATVQLSVAGNWPMPYQLMGYPVIPAALWKVPGLPPVLAFVQNQPNLYAVLAMTVLYIVIAAALISLVYALIYRMIGPARYGPLDAPPPKVSVGRYKR